MLAYITFDEVRFTFPAEPRAMSGHGLLPGLSLKGNIFSRAIARRPGNFATFDSIQRDDNGLDEFPFFEGDQYRRASSQERTNPRRHTNVIAARYVSGLARQLFVDTVPPWGTVPQVTLFMPIKLFILSDARLHRDGLALQLERCPNVKVIGAGTLDDAVRSLRSTPADVALLDTVQLEIPAVVEALRQSLRQLRIVAMGVREVESEVLAYAAAGIDGYVRMDAAVDELITVVESAMRNELVCSPKVAASLYHSVASQGADSGAPLTGRELQVVELISRGLSNKEISKNLRIETCTAKNHVQNILQKLGVHRRGQAAAKVRSSITWQRSG